MKRTRLNIQGLARRDKGLMSSLTADPGYTLVSVDLSAGEPTVMTHYSQDKNYADACFNMVGKAPYYDENGTLKIDDIYLTAASFSPLGRTSVQEAYRNTYSGLEFSEAWLLDSDRIKSELKDVRSLHKILVLGIGYAMGPTKMVKQCYDKGYSITMRDAKEFINLYWDWCPKVKYLSDRLQMKFQTQGYLVNDFGYRLIPDKDYKALNYWIQSSVSGIVNILVYKYFSIFPQAQFVTVIHDEAVFQVPTELLPQARLAMDEAVKSLNEDLKWSVEIRVGWKTGQNLYEAK
jgi:DNA polymerase I-like protein with 3'-5' exonuclease and polymerase domains